MSRLSVRLFLLITSLSAIGAAVFHLWSSDRRARFDAASTRQFNAISRTANVAAGDLRSAQQAYVAAGQGEAFWFERVTAIHVDLEQQLARLRPLATAAGTRAALDEAEAALRDFAAMDQRARDLTRGGQLSLASDMIFADGIDVTKRIADALSRAASAEQVERDAAAARLQRTEVQALAGAAGTTVLTLLLLAGARRAPHAAVAAAPLAPPARAVHAPAPPRAAVAPRVSAVPSAPETPPAASPKIASIATLCNELARISDTQALPALLERAGTVLDATGLVVWIADPDGRELAPILVHGYPPHLATRLGTIARNASNLTAAAYRTGLLQTVKGDAISSGAMAVPLVSAGGCVGVMAAEVKNGGEQQEDLLAAATIVAAQLATLAGPPSARAKAEAAS
jgi:hypothetical protein